MLRDTRARFLSHFDEANELAKRPVFSERVQRLFTGPPVSGGRHVVIAMDVEQLVAQVQLGCQQSQGYLHGAAVPAGEFARMLTRGNGTMLQPAAGRALHGADEGHRRET